MPITQLIIILLPVPLFAFWLWMFRDMINNDRLPGNSRNTWMLLFVFMNVFAAIWYYVAEYRNRY